MVKPSSLSASDKEYVIFSIRIQVLCLLICFYTNMLHIIFVLGDVEKFRKIILMFKKSIILTENEAFTDIIEA